MNHLRILLLFPRINLIKAGVLGIIAVPSCQLRKEEQFMSNGNREFKSDVFSMLLEDPNNALQLYNALNVTLIKDIIRSFWKLVHF